MANQIIHKKSSVVTDGKPKLPLSSDLVYGELAINYAKNNETISLKNSDNEIVEFKSTNYLENIIIENEEITAEEIINLDTKISAHTSSTTIHITSAERTKWNSAETKITNFSPLTNTEITNLFETEINKE